MFFSWLLSPFFYILLIFFILSIKNFQFVLYLHCFMVKINASMLTYCVLRPSLCPCNCADAYALLAQSVSCLCPSIAGVANSKKAGCKCAHLDPKKVSVFNGFQASFSKGKVFGHGC
jgi:hypothetical protein